MPFALCPDLGQPGKSPGLPAPATPALAAGIGSVTAFLHVANARPPEPPL